MEELLMATKPQILAFFLKALSIYYYFLFFLLISVAKKFYEIRATNYVKLCKTNPITKRSKMNVTKVLTRGYKNERLFRRAENKPNSVPYLNALTPIFLTHPPDFSCLKADPSCINAAQFQTFCWGWQLLLNNFLTSGRRFGIVYSTKRYLKMTRKLFAGGRTMLSVENSFYSGSALNTIYASMAGQVSNLPSNILLNNPDRYTGTSIIKDFLRVSIAENVENTSSVNAGISLVQSATDVVETIADKVDQMKQLAEEATTTSQQEDREALQEQFDALADEVTTIASQFNLGGNMLTKDDDTVEISIGSGISIGIDTKDLTISGLGITDNIDIVNDAASALAGLETAVAEIDDYADHLESKAGDLESAAAVLDVQRQSLLAISSAIESADAAMMVVNALNNNYMVQADLFLVAQANLKLMTDTVLRLLAD
jgi:flagellin